MSWLVLLLLLLGVAVLTAAATAVRSVSRIWLRHWAEQCLRGSEAAEIYLERPQRLLLGASAGVVLCTSLAGVVLGARLRDPLELLLAGAVAIVVLLLVGQVVPHVLARRWPTRLVPRLLPVLRGVSVLTAPARALRRAAGRPPGQRPPRDERAIVRDELEELLRESEMEGIGERAENAIIAGVVHFGERRVRDVMTPRARIFALSEATPRAVLAREIADSGYSRVPLFRGTLDDVVGIVYAFDLLDGDRDAALPVRPAAVAEPDDPCSDLLVRMLGRQRHLAIVRDAGGRTVGIVTLEDLLESLVGEIRDEHDEPAIEGAAG